MKRFYLLQSVLAIGAAVIISSCQKEPAGIDAGNGTQSVALSLSFGDVATKSTGGVVTPENPWDTNDEENGTFSSLDIYFTNATGQILYYWRAVSNAGENTSEKTIWDNIFAETGTKVKGVKFIGVSEDVTAVYAVANVGQLTELHEVSGSVSEGTSVNISQVNAQLSITSFGPGGTISDMPYAGASTALSPIEESLINGGAGEVLVDGEEGSSYVSAEIMLRPAVSRIEISDVSIKTSGTNYFTIADDGSLTSAGTTPPASGTEYYAVAWSGLDLDLVGVYMSNIYRQAELFPANTTSEDWQTRTPSAGGSATNDDNPFATPDFDSRNNPINQGSWVALSSSNETELNNILCYSNYNTSYQSIVPPGYKGTASGEEKPLFDGGNAEASASNPGIIPFHFFVPYNLTDDASTAADVDPIHEDVDGQLIQPVLHFQFQETVDNEINVTGVTHHLSNGTEESLTQNDGMWGVLSAEFTLPHTVDRTFFANVTGFASSEGAVAADVTFTPGYIYRLGTVLVDPTVINASVSGNENRNLYVTVAVVPFTERDIYPVFE